MYMYTCVCVLFLPSFYHPYHPRLAICHQLLDSFSTFLPGGICQLAHQTQDPRLLCHVGKELRRKISGEKYGETVGTIRK